jgi:ubiquinone/menaquinone biosynthesis C-methylase UbiE
LELGCGHGLLWKENVGRIPSDWDITLSDLSPGMLDSAWRNLVVIGRSFKFKEIDAQEIPFDDETFDAVIANHMLYHIPDKPKALSEIKRVLKPNGVLFATTIGQNHFKEMADWIQKVNPKGDFGSFGSSFNLENGMEQLKPFFLQVTVSRYTDSLQVTEVKPIIAFIRSTMHAAETQEDEFEKLAFELEQELKENGNIFIQKDSGLFEAVK